MDISGRSVISEFVANETFGEVPTLTLGVKVVFVLLAAAPVNLIMCSDRCGFLAT